jgi:hypothetical protein
MLVRYVSEEIQHGWYQPFIVKLGDGLLLLYYDIMKVANKLCEYPQNHNLSTKQCGCNGI